MATKSTKSAKPTSTKAASAKPASAKAAAKKVSKPVAEKASGAARPAATKKPGAPRPGDLALAVGKSALGSGTPGVVTLDLPGRAVLSMGKTKYALLVRDRDAVLVDLLLPTPRRGEEAKKLGFAEDPSRPGWARIRIGQAAEAWQAAAELARETIAALHAPAAPAPVARDDRFRAVSDALVAALGGAGGNAKKETAAMRAAIEAYVALSEDGDPDRLGVVRYLAEDGSAQHPPAIERVPGCTEEDTLRWRELLLDLAGH